MLKFAAFAGFIFYPCFSTYGIFVATLSLSPVHVATKKEKIIISVN